MLSLYVLYLVGLYILYILLLIYIFCYSLAKTAIHLPRPNVLHLTHISTHILVQPPPPTAYINAHTPKSGTWYVSFRLQRYYIFFEYPNFSGDFCTEKCRIECLSIGYREPRIQREKPLFGVCPQFLMRAREKEQKHN